MQKRKMWIDVHVIQTLGENCINRDDVGSVKTVTYGGVTRQRVSSQAWKRAMFSYLRNKFGCDSDKTGIRTKHVVQAIADEIMKRHPDAERENVETVVVKMLETVKVKASSDDRVLSSLFFISNEQINAFADIFENERYSDLTLNNIENPSDADKKRLDKLRKEMSADVMSALMNKRSVEMFLSGRMCAENPDLTCDSVTQVAHAFSTHAFQTEYDFYTGMDDYDVDGKSGAAFLDTSEFACSTIYRYMTIDVSEMAEHAGTNTPELAAALVEAFVKSMPTGKQNSFANGTIPDAVYVALRTDTPVSFAPAFEQCIKGKDGYVEHSVTAMREYARTIYGNFVDKPETAFLSASGKALAVIEEKTAVPFMTGLLTGVSNAVKDYIRG